MTAASSKPLFNQLGGEAAIQNMIGEFYERVLADPKLNPIFVNVPMDRLKKMQLEFFSAALGGPIAYSGQALSYAHFGRGITKEHFGLFIDHLLDTLKSRNLDQDSMYRIIDRLNTYADEITGGAADAE